MPVFKPKQNQVKFARGTVKTRTKRKPEEEDINFLYLEIDVDDQDDDDYNIGVRVKVDGNIEEARRKAERILIKKLRDW